MKAGFYSAAGLLVLFFFFLVSVTCRSMPEDIKSPPDSPRTITVAQEGGAEVIGEDNAALQKAAGMLRPGDTLEIGPGVYTLDNSVVIPVSGVVVRGVPGKTTSRSAGTAMSFAAIKYWTTGRRRKATVSLSRRPTRMRSSRTT